MKKLDVFIVGETIDLCIPTIEFSRQSEWYSWFNKPSITRFLDQGLFPNTIDEQERFFLAQRRDRLMLIISNKENYMGIVSLSSIDLIKKTCELAIVIDASVDKRQSPYIALEAISCITKHAFEVLGVNRISAGQHIDLSGWGQRMGLLGYKIEGIHENKFIKGREVSDAITIACTFEGYKKVIEARGNLWDTKENFKRRFKQLPKETFTHKLNNFFLTTREQYYNDLFSL